MAKNRVLSAPSFTPAEQEIVSLLENTLKRFETVPGLLHGINTTLADLRHRGEALEQQQPGKGPKRKR